MIAAGGRRRRGHSLMELAVVNVLMGLLMLLMAGAWRAFGPICVEVIGRGRVAGEANLAAAMLWRDTHDGPPDQPIVGVRTTDGASLQLCYDGHTETNPADGQPDWGSGVDRVVSYYLTDDGRLVRKDGSQSLTIASNLDAIAATNRVLGGGSSLNSGVELTLSFAYRGSRGQYTFRVQQ